MPYDIGRKTLYTAEDLYGPDNYDARVYECYLHKGKHACSTRELMARSMHDYCIRKAVEDFMQDRDLLKTVSVMGGHGLLRTDEQFRHIVFISKRLTEEGFLMISGGGPGAMEATHLGAWMAGRNDNEVEQALKMLAAAPSFKDEMWVRTAMEVRQRFPQNDGYESLGVPTWLYGHEPATPFATHIAKYFDNSIREDFILTAAYGGIIFTPGSAGTLQEVFQEAVQNHYLSFGFASPMIFFGSQFWQNEVPIYPLLEHLMANGRYKNLLLSLTDSREEVVKTLLDFKPAGSPQKA
ncbi:MAG: hypothetical protein Q4D23_01290 [Bacteroidales bacterium]|nr:hypothetical protein [Bacteroidales bacterium]